MQKSKGEKNANQTEHDSETVRKQEAVVETVDPIREKPVREVRLRR